MTAQPSHQPAIAVVLVDDDFIFRTGLRVWLSQQTNVTVVGEADRQRAALSLVEQHVEGDRTRSSIEPKPVCVAIASLSLGQAFTPSAPASGVSLVEDLRQRYPTLPILMFSSSLDQPTLSQLRRLAVNGFVRKSAPPSEWLRVLQRIAAGETELPQADLIVAPADFEEQPTTASGGRSLQASRPFALLRRHLRRSGIRQMDAALAELIAQLEQSNLSRVDRWIVEGHCRELRAARWLVHRLLATPTLAELDASDRDDRSSAAQAKRNAAFLDEANREAATPPLSTRPSENPEPGGALVGAGVETLLFNGIMIKINGPLTNQSGVVLEIDILRSSKKRDLLYVVVRQLMDLLEDLRQAEITPQQLSDRQSLVLRDLWQRVTDEFFGRYYAIQVDSDRPDSLEIEVVRALSEAAETAQTTILDTIPYSTDLLAHLLFLTPLQIDSISYVPGTPEAMLRAERLLDHFVVQVGNSVIQPLLNQLGDVEVIKQTFYDRSLMSSREVARFRNALSWRYRTDQLIQTPTLIFESQYRLFTLSGGGITSTLIYAPRRTELEMLQGLPFLVTLVLEVRDAVAPQLRAIVSWIGSGLIYVLTEVLGRGIGLIIRGVIKGIGSAWQDIRLSRDADQRRL